MALNLDGLTELDTTGLTEVGSDLDVSGLTELDTSGLTEVSADASAAEIPATAAPAPAPSLGDMEMPGAMATQGTAPLPREPVTAPKLPDKSKPESGWLETGAALAKTTPDLFKQAGAGTLRALMEAKPEPHPGQSDIEYSYALEDWKERVGKDPVSQWAAQVYAEAEESIKAAQPNIDPESLKGYAFQIAQSVIQMAPSLAAGIATRSPTVGSTVMLGQVYGQEYGEARQAGRSPDQAGQDALFYSVAEALPERLPLGIILKEGSTLIGRMVKGAAAEGIQEQFTEALRMGYETGVLDKNEDMTWGDALARLKNAGIVGAGAGASMAAAAHPFTRESKTADGAPPAPPGVIESAGATPAPVTEDDVESPIPTELIQAGKTVLQQADAQGAANELLKSAGAPEVGTPVSVTYENGNTVTGQVVDAFSVSNAELGTTATGIKIRFDDGGTLEELVDTLRDAGVQITPSGIPGSPEPTIVPSGTLPAAGEAQIPAIEAEIGLPSTEAAPMETEGTGIRQDPVKVQQGPDIDVAGQVVAEPTEAQKEAGNYQKAHVKWAGLDISIENPKGSERSGKDPNGQEWSVTMPASYGYIKRTEGADGEQVDIYLGDKPLAPNVFVVDQVDAESGVFDEHKVMVGFASQAEAEAAYEAGFSDGKGAARKGAVTPMSREQFKAWLKDGDTVNALAYEPANRAPAATPKTEPEPESTEDEVRELLTRMIAEGKATTGFNQTPAGATITYGFDQDPRTARKPKGGDVVAYTRTGQRFVFKRKDLEPKFDPAPRTHSHADKEFLRRALKRAKLKKNPLIKKAGDFWQVTVPQGEAEQMANAMASELEAAAKRSQSAKKARQTRLANRPLDIVQWIAANGGIKLDDARIGEIRHILGTQNKLVADFGPLIRKAGKSIQELAEAAGEDGYFGTQAQQYDENQANSDFAAEFFAAIRDTLAGNRKFTEAGALLQQELDRQKAEALAGDQAQGTRESIKAIAKEHGEMFGESDIDAAVELMTEQGMDVETAVDAHIERLAIKALEVAESEAAGDDYDVPFGSTESDSEAAEGGDGSPPFGEDPRDGETGGPVAGEGRDSEESQEDDGELTAPAAFDPAAAIKLVADSPDKIRAQDLDRLFAETDRKNYDDLRVYLIEQRPDLGAEILDAIEANGGADRGEAQFDTTAMYERMAEKGRRIQAALRAGKRLAIPLNEGSRVISSLDQIKVGKQGVYTSRGKNWDALTEPQLDALLAQAGQTTEQTDQGEQTVLPGGERMSQEAADAAKAAEAAALEADRQRVEREQSKLRKGNQQSVKDQKGGLFSSDRDQTDIFDAPKKPAAPTVSKTENVAPDVKADGWGAKNKLVSKDRAEELRARLKNKLKNQLSAGIDPEIMAIGVELTAFHIEAGARKFVDLARAIAADLGVGIDAIRPYLRSWYNGARDMMEDAGEDVADMDSPDAVRAALKSLEEAPDVPSPAPGVEPDRSDATAQDELGETPVSDAAGEDGRGAGSGEQAPRVERDDRSDSQGGLFADRPAPVGGRGGRRVPGGKSGVRDGAAANDGRERGASDRVEGLSDDRVAPERVKEAARSSDLSRAEQQRAADQIPVKHADIDNIRATLPLLTPEQQDDVLKAETRFAKAEGMMFTNGTGTGKTYTGAGIAKRFVRRGKTNILVIAPSQDILKSWKDTLADLGVEASILESTTTAGQGVVLTTYANLGENQTLVDRKWDLVIPDESQKLMSAKDGSPTAALKTLRAITGHPRGHFERAMMTLRAEWAPIEAAEKLLKGKLPKDMEAKRAALYEKTRSLSLTYADLPRSKVTFLSATPFAYVETIDYGEGYLFSYSGGVEGRGYNQPDNQQAFFMQHFGYRMRTGSLTKPDAGVDSGVMEREFHEWMKREGSLSARALEVEADYERRFVLVEDAIGAKIDDLMKFLWEADSGRFRPLADLVRKRFDYLTRMRLLEAIKARHAIPRIKKHLALGRKVVVFHDYNEGGGINPFEFDDGMLPDKATIYVGDKRVEVDVRALYREFIDRNPDVPKMMFRSYGPPIAALQAAFPNALIYNGNVPNKQRTEAKRRFNDDTDPDANLIVIQSAAGEAGISAHDTTGKHQRVLINLGMPVRPVTAVQEEGRIYRLGQVTDAIFEYLNTGTNWERWVFAGSMAERTGTAENLGMGNRARALKQSFIDAFIESDIYEPKAGDGKGGKERDRRADAELSGFQRAKTFYWAQQKKTGRRDRREGVDYYATPEPVGFKMVEFANLQLGEKVLEPSAGHGAIARFLPENTARTLIEPAETLASKAGLAAPGATVRQERFEDLHINNKYDAIVMNPPYGSGGKTAIEHLAKAATHLRNGGRIVALIPDGGMATKRFEQFMDSDAAKGIYIVADIKMPAVTFERAGTSVRTQIVVLEKQTDAEVAQKIQQKSRDYSDETDINGLFDRLENLDLPARLEPKTKDADVDEDGNAVITVGEYEMNLRQIGEGPTAGFTVELANKVGKPAYARYARTAEGLGATVFQKGFIRFDTAEKRQEFVAALANPLATPAVQATGGFTAAETTHGKTGEKLYVASMVDRVERDAYNAINAVAKKHGGWYSSFRGAGAIPGFQFKSEEKRAAFLAEMSVDPKAKIADPQSREFRRWFQDSKVVDKNGEPLVVYHGTDADFDTFEMTSDIGFHFGSRDTAGKRVLSMSGFGVTPGESAKSAYRAAQGASFIAENGVVMPVYLSIQNPLRMDDLGTWEPNDVIAELQRRKVLTESEAEAARGETIDREWVVKTLAAKGYDGIVYKNGIEGGGDSWIALRPEQIKSVFNQGTFKPNLRSIMMHRGGRARRAALAEDLRKRMIELGIADRVAMRVVDRLKDPEGGTFDGQFWRGIIDVSAKAGDKLGTLNHEAIHAMRWLGLFTDMEWRELVKSATTTPALMGEIRRLYPNLSPDALHEEAVAELFNRWAASRIKPKGFVAKALDTIKKFLRAFGLAIEPYRGVDGVEMATEEANAILSQVEAGNIGRRFYDGEGRLRDRFGRFVADERAHIDEPGPMGLSPKFHAAWHGSPHDLEGGRFSLGKIGTGEGAQAYGWGLYFAGKKAVAEFYRNKLSGPGELYLFGKRIPDDAATWLNAQVRNIASLIDQRGMTFSAARDSAVEDLRWRAGRDKDPEIQEAIAELERAKESDFEVRRGRLYQVELAPREDEYLLWDKPLSEQSDKVKAALRTFPEAPDESVWDHWTGQQFYESTVAATAELTRENLRSPDGRRDARHKAAEALSKALRLSGIPGLKYLDGSSRGNANYRPQVPKYQAKVDRLQATYDENPTEANLFRLEDAKQELESARRADEENAGTYNYVIFDDALVEVVAMFSRRETEGRPVDPNLYVPNTQRDPRRIPRGAGAIADRLRSQMAFDRLFNEKAAAKGTQPRVPVTREDIRDIESFLDWLGEHMTARLGISLQAGIRGSGVLGEYDPFARIVTIFREAIERGSLTHTTIHELWHGVWGAMSNAQRHAVVGEYARALRAYGRTRPWFHAFFMEEDWTVSRERYGTLLVIYPAMAQDQNIVLTPSGDYHMTYSRETYRYLNPLEYWAETMTDKYLDRREEMDESARSFFGAMRVLWQRMMATVRRIIRRDVTRDTSALLRAFERGEIPPVTDASLAELEAGVVQMARNSVRPPRPPNAADKVTFDNAKAEERWQDARKGIASQETLVKRMGDWFSTLVGSFARHYANLPNIPRFADVKEQLRKLEAAPQDSKERVIRILRQITDGMTPEDLDLFTRKVVLDDLAWEITQSRQIPFGLTEDEVKAELAKLDAILANRPDLTEAVRERKLIAREVANQLVKAGVLTREQASNPSYYRHQVLDYARAEVAFAQGAGRKLKSPYWARREGSALDINANLLEAEFDWLHKAFVNITQAETIDWIKTSNLNIRGQVIAKAKAHNQKLVDEQLAKDMKANGYTLPNGRQTSPLHEQWMGFKQGIAMGLGRLRKALEDGAVQVPPMHRDAALTLQTGQGDTDIFPFLAWIMETNQPGAASAAQVFKAISGRKEWVKTLLGTRYADTTDISGLLKDFAPEGYVAWQPREGKLMFLGKTLPEHVVDKVLAQVAAQGAGNIPAAELLQAFGRMKESLMVGGNRYEMVLPEELAATLDELSKAREEHLIEFLAERPTRLWKVWTLFNPRRVLKYNANNASGDLDAIIAGNPKVLRHIGRAARELWQVMVKKQAPSARYLEAVKRGVFDSGYTVQEIPDINELSEFASLMDKPHPAGMPLRAVRAFWQFTRGATTYRENVFRYAAYIDYVERLEAGETMGSIGYGAVHPDILEAVTDKKDRAGLLARSLIGDYGNISVAGQQLRRFIFPFWSFLEINLKRYWRLSANAWGEGVGKGLATTGGLTVAKGARITAYLYLRMLALYVVVNLWNNLVFGDDEDKLTPEERARLHLHLWKTGDGELVTMRLQGSFSDIVSWFGVEDAIQTMWEVEKGRGSLWDVLGAIAGAPVNKLTNAAVPLLKAPLEAAFGQQLFPDVFEPRPIRDGWRHMFRTFSLENEYDLLTGKPSRGYGRSWAEAMVYRRHPGEMAYGQIQGLAHDWLRREKGQEGRSSFSSPRSRAVYEWKTALRYGDKDAAEQARQKLFELGVGGDDLDDSVKRAHPLGAIALKDRAKFKMSLTDAELDRLQSAIVWYQETFVGR